MRVAVLGGSSVATIQLGEAVADWPGGSSRRPPLEFVLHGRSETKLTAVADRFGKVAASAAWVWPSLVLEEVLDGADVVLVQVRVSGLPARSFDESFPWRAGLPGEETLGPGGFANALRTVRALRKTWPVLRRLCPDALVVILTNPAGIVAQAAAAQGLRVVEVCDSPVAFVDAIATRLGVDSLEVARRYVGMNHVGWYVPASTAELETLCSGQAVAADVVRAHQAVPLGYVRYYIDPDRIYAAQLDQPTRAEHLMQVEVSALSRLAEGKSPDSKARAAPWYRLAVVPVLDGLANGSQTPMILGRANDGRLSALSADATVEGLAQFSAAGTIESLGVTRLPPLPAALLYRHATYERLAIEAAQRPQRANLLRAMLANPMIATAHQATVLTDVLQGCLAQETSDDAAEAGQS